MAHSVQSMVQYSSINVMPTSLNVSDSRCTFDDQVVRPDDKVTANVTLFISGKYSPSYWSFLEASGSRRDRPKADNLKPCMSATEQVYQSRRCVLKYCRKYSNH